MTRPLRQLWRLETSGESGPIDQARLTEGLRLHLRYVPLTTVLVRIGQGQQAYLVLAGCDGCARERCQPGCRVELLRRLFNQAVPHLRLHLIARGLALRPYTTGVLAVPGRRPQPLDGTMLAPWDEARLVVGWQQQGLHLRTGALLAVAAGETNPVAALRDRGWQAWRMPARLARHWAQAAVPSAVLCTGARDLTPGLLLAEPTAMVSAAVATPALMPELDARLADWLHTLIHQPAAGELGTHANEDTDSIPSIWPAGPHGLDPATLETLVCRIVAEPSFQSQRKGQSGISKGRLASLKTHGLNDAIARSLMVWFDRAGVLAAPEHGQSPWRAPRPFAYTEPEQIAARLRATPLPAGDDVRAAYGGDG